MAPELGIQSFAAIMPELERVRQLEKMEAIYEPASFGVGPKSQASTVVKTGSGHGGPTAARPGGSKPDNEPGAGRAPLRWWPACRLLRPQVPSPLTTHSLPKSCSLGKEFNKADVNVQENKTPPK
jgi:hypothetical protein